MKRMYALMIGAGLAIDAVEVLTLIYAIKSGIWWPFIAGMALVIISAVLLTRYYYKHTAYICPECHEVFKPRFWEAFFAPHTPKTRKLTCPHCGKKSYCVESYAEE